MSEIKAKMVFRCCCCSNNAIEEARHIANCNCARSTHAFFSVHHSECHRMNHNWFLLSFFERKSKKAHTSGIARVCACGLWTDKIGLHIGLCAEVRPSGLGWTRSAAADDRLNGWMTGSVKAIVEIVHVIARRLHCPPLKRQTRGQWTIVPIYPSIVCCVCERWSSRMNSSPIFSLFFSIERWKFIICRVLCDTRARSDTIKIA